MKITKTLKVGIFLIGGVLLFGAGLFLIGNHSELFGHHYTVYTEFANIAGIQSGASVQVSGMNAGTVADVNLPRDPSGKFRVQLKLDQKFRNIIREDSKTSIQTQGMVGNQFVNIDKGTNTSPECNGCTLPSKEPVQLSDLLQQAKGIMSTVPATIADLQQHADTAMNNFAHVGGHVDQMVVSMRPKVDQIASNGVQMTKGANQIIAGVRNGRGTVGKLLTDDKMANQVNATVTNVQKASANVEQASNRASQMVADLQQQHIPEQVQQTVANARDMSQQLDKAVGNFLNTGKPGQSTADALKDTIGEADRAARNLGSDTEAIKHNFFLRGFFHRRGFYNLTFFNPTEYEKSEFVKKPAKRTWLSANGMFTTTENGEQELTNQGKAALDRAMSELANDLPNNPIMVEGYADVGSPAERFLSSSQRATAVKEYLESKLDLNPDLIGTIGLGDKPPRGTGKESWDGLCLALVVSKD